MSSTSRVPVCVTLPPDLIERADRLAEADERSRSYIVTRALQTYCDQIEIPPPSGRARDADAARSVDDAAGPGAPSQVPAAALSYPASLHRDALRRSAAVHSERAETARQHRERVAAETAQALKDLGK